MSFAEFKAALKILEKKAEEAPKSQEEILFNTGDTNEDGFMD